MSDAEPPKAYRQVIRKARKQHRCYECRGLIEKGEEYHYHSGIWDDPAAFKVCSDCEQLREDLDKGSDIYETTPFGGISDWASELGGEIQERYVSIMQKRGAKIHPSWLKEVAS